MPAAQHRLSRTLLGAGFSWPRLRSISLGIRAGFWDRVRGLVLPAAHVFPVGPGGLGPLGLLSFSCVRVRPAHRGRSRAGGGQELSCWSASM